MRLLVLFAIVLTLFGIGVGLTLAAPEPSHVAPASLGGPEIRGEVSTGFPEGPYAGCDAKPEPLGPEVEGPDCR
jgi:hypothetical protein